MTLFFILLTVLSFQQNQGQTITDPLVDTTLGWIRGLKADDGDYSMFLGIPYAQVDEAKPFGDALPQPAFDEIFDANDDTARCPQVEEFNNTIVGNLDCLHINVYVPDSVTASSPLPVLIWIHGGGFQYGDGGRYVHGPKYFMKQDVILVTLNYRLGPYGFMCLDIPEVPGNQGLKDQLLALRWINANIEAFGGDVNKITLFGESAGGMSVDLHLVSPQDQLYHQAIIQSGTSLSNAFYEPVKNAPILIANNLGYATENIYSALEFLATTETDLIIQSGYDLDIYSRFRPCVEKEFENVVNFITEDWSKTVAPTYKDMPILLGFNDDEWLSRYYHRDDDFFRNLDIVKTSLPDAFDTDSEDFQGMEDVVKRFYFGDELNLTRELSLFKVADFASDFSFNYPTYRTIDRMLDNESGNIYFYLFSYVGDRNWVKRRVNIIGGGAVHADELSYLFDISFWKDEIPTPDDQQVIDRMTTMWANFVKYGNPTPDTTDLLPVTWTPVTQGSRRHCLVIDSELSMTSRPFSSRMSFWELFHKTNSDLQRLYVCACSALAALDGYSPQQDPDQFHIQTDEDDDRYFLYQTHNGQYRKERRLKDGSVVGTSGWVGADGFLRLQDYIADDQGYRIYKSKTVYVGQNRPIGESLNIAKTAPTDSGIGVTPAPAAAVNRARGPPRFSTTPATPIPSSTFEPPHSFPSEVSVTPPPPTYPSPTPTPNVYVSPNSIDSSTTYDFRPTVPPITSSEATSTPNPFDYDAPNTNTIDDYYGSDSSPYRRYDVYNPNSYRHADDWLRRQRPGVQLGDGYTPQFPGYDGVAFKQNGFRYYLPKQYHEEQTVNTNERTGSFGYVDPFGIRRVIYYNTVPGEGFQIRKNNRYVGHDATPYDPRPIQ